MSDSDCESIATNTNLPTGSKRTTFTTFEIKLLLSLVEAKKKILEDKKTDFINLEKKRKGWDQLTTEFNSSAEVTARTKSQLQKKWDNLKSRAKKDVCNNSSFKIIASMVNDIIANTFLLYYGKKVSENQRKKRKIGGGSPPPPVPDVSDKVASIIPSQMKPLENEFDCDAWIMEQRKEVGLDIDNIEERGQEIEPPKSRKT
ncbi:Myb/SANT-like DNA-binding domain-containing protein 3 [Folsomia candida]|uniref:Regulatory protein zeste n=1 Tax=Folsomia candida TaxID=158441 RepID=A0A226DLY8_FOLCA|nr:Myb/SANT-like DNA-binding domain-containing protein 3 [Folsomia candida]